MERLGDAPGDGVVVGQSEDQGTLALKQSHMRSYLLVASPEAPRPTLLWLDVRMHPMGTARVRGSRSTMWAIPP